MPCREGNGKFCRARVRTDDAQAGCNRALPNFFVLNIHLLKTMTLELRNIQTLRNPLEPGQGGVYRDGRRIVPNEYGRVQRGPLWRWKFFKVGVDGW